MPRVFGSVAFHLAPGAACNLVCAHVTLFCVSVFRVTLVASGFSLPILVLHSAHQIHFIYTMSLMLLAIKTKTQYSLTCNVP
eukprot:m.170191 g.170191  ORF g.170191 m.170191 type:complete len:82 (+) comp14521_c0_seq2:42-287(+)